MTRRKNPDAPLVTYKPSGFIHIMIRVRSEDGLTVSAHRAVINQHKKVLFAKIGKGASDALVNQLTQQIEQQVPTFLFVAIFSGFNEPFAIYQCNLTSARNTIENTHLELVPTYLRALVPKVGTWFEITSFQRVAESEIKRIHIYTSGREASSSLRGMTSLFKVGVSGSEEMKKMADAPIKKKSLKVIDDSDLDGDLYDDNYDDVTDWTPN